MRSLLVASALLVLSALSVQGAVKTFATPKIEKAGSVKLSKPLSENYPTFTGNGNYFVPYLENGTVAVVDVLSQKELFTFKVIGAQTPRAIVTPNGDVLVYGGESWLAFNAQGQFLYEDDNLYLPNDAEQYVEGSSLYYPREGACVRRFDVSTGQKSTVVPDPGFNQESLQCNFVDTKTVLYSHARMNYNNGDYSDKWLAKVEIATNKTLWNISDVAGSYRGEDSNYFYVSAFGASQYSDNIFTVINKTDVSQRKQFPGFVAVGQGLGFPTPGLVPRTATDNTNLLTLAAGGEVQRLNRLNMANGVIEKQYFLGQDTSVTALTDAQLINFNEQSQKYVSYSYPGADSLCEGTTPGGAESSSNYNDATVNFQSLPGTSLLVVDTFTEILIVNAANCERIMSISRPLSANAYQIPETVVDAAHQRFTFQVGDTVEIYSYSA